MPHLVSNQFGQGMGLSDDEFFHLTCHIDKAMHDKIEKGDYVDLEKLLPKGGMPNLPNPNAGLTDGNRLEWIQKDGHTFLAPVMDKNNKINSFRRWEQAFRMYATIYCGANPGRAKEIWQYISVINTASASYVWENVYSYDVIFRHLMAFNPQRSWAITYNQMWNLAMREPLNRNNKFSFGGNGGTNNTASSNQRKPTGGKKKVKYCWNWNKGIKCKYDAKCHFIERCSYCDSPNHGLDTCVKAKKKNVTQGNELLHGEAK